MAELNVPNRTLAVMDNLDFVRSLNSESIDLIATDPPFAANETFEGKLRKPITPDELAEEKALARKHGVPHREGVGETRVDDVWRWDRFRHEQWLGSWRRRTPTSRRWCGRWTCARRRTRRRTSPTWRRGCWSAIAC